MCLSPWWCVCGRQKCLDKNMCVPRWKSGSFLHVFVYLWIPARLLFLCCKERMVMLKTGWVTTWRLRSPSHLQTALQIPCQERLGGKSHFKIRPQQLQTLLRPGPWRTAAPTLSLHNSLANIGLGDSSADNFEPELPITCFSTAPR